MERSNRLVCNVLIRIRSISRVSMDWKKWSGQKPGNRSSDIWCDSSFIRSWLPDRLIMASTGSGMNTNHEEFSCCLYRTDESGTRCRQLALYTIFDSPINMLCDAPTNYLKEEECTKFIAAIPTVWNQTPPISRKSKHIVMAREKTVSGMWVDWPTGKSVLMLKSICLSWVMVSSMQKHLDSINADRVGKDYKREVIRVSANKKLNYTRLLVVGLLWG